MLTSNEVAFLTPLKDTARANEPRRPSARAWISDRSDYCFGADAAEAADEAASAAALAAAAESAAAEAAESGAGVAAGGGVVSLVGAGASVLLPQALSTNAATKALNASLVFIYRYPRNLMITF
jgi:predicted phage tail protein